MLYKDLGDENQYGESDKANTVTQACHDQALTSPLHRTTIVETAATYIIQIYNGITIIKDIQRIPITTVDEAHKLIQ